MSISASTAGDYFYIPEALIACKPKSGYTAAKGDLVREESAAAMEWDRCAANENPEGIVVSLNGFVAGAAPSTITVAKLIPEVSHIRLEWLGATPALGNLMEAGSTPGKGTVTMTDRDVVTVDNTNGNLEVRAVETATQTVIVKRVGRTTASPGVVD